jgi:hypothetical protein
MFFLREWCLRLKYGNRGFEYLYRNENTSDLRYADETHANYKPSPEVIEKKPVTQTYQQGYAPRQSRSKRKKKSDYDPINFFDDIDDLKRKIMSFLKENKKGSLKKIKAYLCEKIRVKSIRDKAMKRSDISDIIISCLKSLAQSQQVIFDKYTKEWKLCKSKTRPISDKESRYLKNLTGSSNGWRFIENPQKAIDWMHDHYTPDDFENFCCSILSYLNCSDVHVSQKRSSGADGGVDGYGNLIKNDGQKVKFIMQAKRYAKHNFVTENNITQFLGTYDAQDVDYGIFITTGFYSEKSRELEEKIRKKGEKKMKLIDCEELVDLMQIKTRNGNGVGLVVTPDLNRAYMNIEQLKKSSKK